MRVIILDELELIYLFPLMMVLVPLVYLIRAKLFNEVRGNDLKSFEEDLISKKNILGNKLKTYSVNISFSHFKIKYVTWLLLTIHQCQSLPLPEHNCFRKKKP